MRPISRIPATRWRRVVPSPEPMELPGCAGIEALADAGIVVICTGGGGIPVLEDDKGVYGVEGVIDKDLTAEKSPRPLTPTTW